MSELALPWLTRRAALTPDGEAFVEEGQRLRWRALDARVRRRCAALRARGVQRGDVVALCAGEGLASAELLHAADRAGFALLPLGPRLSAGEIAHALRDSGARWLFYEEAVLAPPARAGLEAHLAGPNAPTIESLSVLREAEHEDDAALEPLPAERIVAVLYTSGTGGVPKGALLSHRAFAASARASAAHLGASPRDRWLACMPLHHVGGLSILVRSAMAGSAVLVQPRFEPEALSRALRDESVTALSLVPTMLHRFLEQEAGAIQAPELRLLLLGGAAAPPALIARALAAGLPVAPTYGLTEAASQVATRRPDAVRRDPDGALEPLPGTRIRITDDAGSALPPGGEGEIRVSTATLMSGYLGRPEESARALEGGWLRTGDIGAIDASGGLRVLDRRSDLIVSGGENVYPAEIEAVLLEHPAIAEAGVAGIADAEWGARPVAWVVAKEGASLDAARLAAHCRARLAGFKIPIRFERVASLPRGPGGKLLRRYLARPEGADRKAAI
jgi:o-succinylbenzoate---CoA ligase